MAGRVLTFKEYLGGSDNVQVIEMTPSMQKTFTYNYGANVANYGFEADYRTIVVDTLTYDRVTGDPNFTDTVVLGSFANAEINANNIVRTDDSNGVIDFTIPAQRYTGNIIPDARSNVAITVTSFKWTNNDVTPATTDMHRWAIIERWEADVTPGNPTLSAGYTAIPIT